MRKTATFVGTSGRDKGKRYLITEMSATQAEKWATRAMLAIGRSLPSGAMSSNIEKIAVVLQHGLQALFGTSFIEAEPLMDEMMECVEALPDKNNPTLNRALVEDDIEEVATRLQLRDEVIKLHVNFSLGDLLRTWGSTFKRTGGVGSSDTPMSPSSSEPSSEPS